MGLKNRRMVGRKAEKKLEGKVKKGGREVKGRRHYNSSAWKDFERKVILFKYMYIGIGDAIQPSAQQKIRFQALFHSQFVSHSPVSFLSHQDHLFWIRHPSQSTPLTVTITSN